uniref:cysteine desulfurase n=1 Tax=Trichomonas vaginalis TaxID=5722 RepID=Q95WH0_TRIVA|nr:IscS/NifS-like protein [Trichomonas vaginalis]
MLTNLYNKAFHGHYLDAQATSILDPRVLDAMLPFETHKHGNPHSTQHGFGKEAHDAVEKARKDIARAINAEPNEIIFTGGATECGNISIKGSMRYLKQKGKKHLIVSNVEHKCILESALDLEPEGFEATILPVKKDGTVDPADVEKAIRPDTGLVSCMAVNNEIGTINPLADIAQVCKAHDVLFHTDAAQAFGKIPIDVKKMGINLLSLTGHKIHGPKGIGALFIGSKPRVRVEPIVSGGGQERNIRSGTLAVPLIVGLGKAAEIAYREMKYDSPYVESLGKYLISEIQRKLPKATFNGSLEHRWFGCVNVSLNTIESAKLMTKIPEFAFSSGSACIHNDDEPSYVLKAIGLSKQAAKTTVRIGLSKFTTKEDVDLFLKKLEELQ